MRKMTGKEQRWWDKFKKLHGNIPTTIEVVFEQGRMRIQPSGTCKESEELHGDAYVSLEYWEMILMNDKFLHEM